MNTKNTWRISKFLSLVLRHKPETIGLTLDEHGWADLGELIEKMRERQFEVDVKTIKFVVANNNKKRFKLDLENNRIRANQGHSVEVDVELKAEIPPEKLFHGTAIQNIGSIKRTGLEKRSRLHVHLSADRETAISVGSRYGQPVVLVIKALKMHEAGYPFYVSENGVWLVDNIPLEYISF